MLILRGLTRPGLQAVEFELGQGEAVAVFGPSGSGKTLFLRAIADLDPSEGYVALGQRERDRMPAPEWRRLVTYMAAETAWWADTVRDHFGHPLAAGELLPALRLPKEAMAWKVARLSTGERQRLALARVLALSPQVMLLDEPTSGLDKEARLAVETVLTQRLEAGAGILFVTHDEDQARRLCRRSLRVTRGVVSEQSL